MSSLPPKEKTLSMVSVEANRPNPEVLASKPRRTFTAKYKQQILEELDNCHQQGDIGAVLRREGLYSSQITTWRRQRREGAFKALNQPRGRKPKYDAKEQAIFELEKENQKLKQQLAQAIILLTCSQ